jgi:hypothetical protein
MMKRTLYLCLVVILSAAGLPGQCTDDSAKLDDASLRLVFAAQAKSVFLTVKNHPNNADSLQGALDDSVPFLVSWAAGRNYGKIRSRLADLELERWDKETSDSAGAAGSTSITSMGSVSSLFSFAVENGALTRTVSGTTITFRTSPANVLAALQKHGWWAAGPSVPQFDGSFESIAKRFSVFVSFDPSRGDNSNGNPVFTGDRQQFAGWGARFEIINKRDPRHPAYRAEFFNLMQKQGEAAANQLRDADKAIRKDPRFDARYKEITNALAASVGSHPTDEAAILNDYVQAAPKYQALLCSFSTSTVPEDQAVFMQNNKASDRIADLLLAKADLFNDIARSFTLAVEYNFTKQANTNGTLPAGMDPANGKLPDLGNLNVVASKGFSDGPEFTANAGFTWFQNLPAGSRSGRMRDARASAQIDFPLPEIQKIGKITLSVSGLYLSMLEEPLGQQVLVNDVPITQKGTVGLAQAKLTIPTKSAVSIPLSLTWASRTELIKESDVRGNIGITLDLDKLFAKGDSQ